VLVIVKLLYKPFGIVAGIVGGLLAKRVFNLVWGLVDEEEPPSPTTERATWPKVLGAAAAQGLTFSVTRAAVDRAGAKSFQHVIGAWPGEKEPDPAGDAKK
jgi:xanthosine utilization system XapX-like protein